MRSTWLVGLILTGAIGGIVWVLAPSISAPAAPTRSQQSAAPAPDPTRPAPVTRSSPPPEQSSPAPIEVPIEVPVPTPIDQVARVPFEPSPIEAQDTTPAIEEIEGEPEPESVAIAGLPDGPDPLAVAAALFPAGGTWSELESASPLAGAPSPDAAIENPAPAPRETPGEAIVHKNPSHAGASQFGGSMANTALPFQADDPELVLGEGDGSFEVVKKDDRTHVVGERWVIKGSGSSDDPMRVSWQMLAAAQQAYNPSAGLEELPKFASVINGKTVKIDGYMLLPLYGDTVTELLAMRNQWDGCCIGVPPTPYDAIEVRLAEAPKGVSRWQLNYGAITGTFTVDPFLRRNRLMGLYVMDDARLETRGF